MPELPSPARIDNPAAPSASVAIIGGGLAGLAAGCALVESGFRVTVFERRPYVGGRASSYQHPGTGEIVDNCQHVLLGCCTNLIAFYQRLGVQDKIRWYEQLTFLEPGGRASILRPSGLPAPFHMTPAFLGADCLGLADKASLSYAMAMLTRKTPKDSGKTFLSWLREHHQTEQAIQRFWKPVLVSALNEELDCASIPSAAQVIRESFLNSAEAGRMGVPTVPLTELYGAAGEYIQARGGEVRLRSAVESFEPQADSVKLLAGGREMIFDYLIPATPFDALSKMLPPTPDTDSLRSALKKFETSPITGIHLWFDREITELDHAVLLDRTIQWMFHKSKLLQDGRGRPSLHRSDGSSAEADKSYVELVVSASKSLVDKSRAEIIELAVKELREFFPKAREASLIKSTVIKEVHATYSPQPGADDYRPRSTTAWPRIFLAGDWTATGWPATMEGAVRSGYSAAEHVARASGRPNKFLVADLPRAGLMKLFK
ncbi:MAG: hydroxysqualene dehydroxylase HpnE [Terriglobales bacterium]